MQWICGTWLDVKVKLSAAFQILMRFIIFFLKHSHPDSNVSIGTLFENIIIFNSKRILHKKRKYRTLVALNQHDDFLPQSYFLCEEWTFFESLPDPVARNILIFEKSQNKESHTRLERWGRVKDIIFTFGLIIAVSYFSQTSSHLQLLSNLIGSFSWNH